MRIVGFDIGGTSIKAGTFQPGKGLSELARYQTPVGDPEALVDILARHAKKAGADLIGVGTAGSIDTRTGLVFAGNLDWWGVPLREMVEAKTDLPVWVDNDAQAALMAEAYDGGCAGRHSALYLTLGTGIGGAALIDGKPWRGHSNTAIELGHMITHADGLPCPCTKRGCFEMYASAAALCRLAGGVPAHQVVARAQAGDAEMQACFDAYLHELGIGLASLISIFNPEVILLGGGLSHAGSSLLWGVRREVETILLRRPDYFQGRIDLALHKNDAGMIGAAMLAKHYCAGG